MNNSHKTYILGPCSAETPQQLMAAADIITRTCHTCAIPLSDIFFRAGLWKPRTSPYSFAGVGEEGIEWLLKVRDRYKLRIATEVATTRHLDLCAQASFDAIWIGARTSTNPFMVDELASHLQTLRQTTGWQPVVIIKNPITPDIKLWQGATQRFLDKGINSIILCHRGFSNFTDSVLRNQPLWSLVIQMRRLFPTLPMLCDVSHIAGKREPIPILADQALQLGLDGLMIEVHNAPEQALSDAQQQLSELQLTSLFRGLQHVELHTTDDRLTEYRQTLDEIDNQLWLLIARRQDVSAKIGDLKRQQGLPIFQPERLEQILSDRLKWAQRNDISEECVRAVIEALHSESVRRQIIQNTDSY